MKLKNTKNKLLLLLLVLSLFLTSCSLPNQNNLSNPMLSNYRSGSEGVELNFIENLPPSELYFSKEFISDNYNIGELGVMVSNKGASDTKNAKLVIHGYDPTIFSINNKDIRGYGSIGLNFVNNIYLKGKSLTNPFGDYEYYIFDIFLKKGLPGDISEFKLPLIATTCYSYETILEQDICIDPQILPSQSQIKKSCEFTKEIALVPTLPWQPQPQPTTTSSSILSLLPKSSKTTTSSGSNNYGQGGPVSITKIEAQRNMIPGGVRFIYLIHFANVGSGEVISKDKCDENYKGNLNQTVNFYVTMGDYAVDCEKNSFELINGEEKIIKCYYDAENTNNAYITQMKIVMNYNYSTSISTFVDLKTGEMI